MATKSILLARNSRVEEDLVDQLFNSSEKRLARNLLLLANFGKEGRPEPIIANGSQETFAEISKTGLDRLQRQHRNPKSLLDVVLHDQPQIRT